MERSLHVLIAGGGLSGLCLAQGLLKEGHTVEVFERDADLSRKAGYLLHVNGDGGNALEACLPDDLYELYLETSRRTPKRRQSIVLTDQLHEVSSIKRRSGAVVLVDEQQKISGIFSDGDLRRAITDDDGSVLRRPIRELMTRNPKRIRGDQLASEAIALMRPHRIDELPVVDDDDRPIGLIDIQDLVVLRMLDVQE